jgi:hypothetical protein
MGGEVDIEIVIAELADAQHGVVARRQLVAAGGSAGTRIDVTVRGSGERRHPGIRLHRRHAISADETTVHAGIPVTTAARTLLDLAATQPRRVVERALDQAEVLRLFDLGELRQVTTAHRGRPGAPLLAQLLDDGDAGATVTRSELEDAFVALCDAAGLPRPLVNTSIEGIDVDFHWRAERLVVEVDGFRYHGTRRAFERDRARDAQLAAAGWRTLRFSHVQVFEHPGAVIRAVTRSLSTSPPHGWSSRQRHVAVDPSRRPPRL